MASLGKLPLLDFVLHDRGQLLGFNFIEFIWEPGQDLSRH